jgi:hypothetical protein
MGFMAGSLALNYSVLPMGLAASSAQVDALWAAAKVAAEVIEVTWWVGSFHGIIYIHAPCVLAQAADGQYQHVCRNAIPLTQEPGVAEIEHRCHATKALFRKVVP